MIEDVYEPLEQYKSCFREQFSRNAEDAFDELVRLSGVDVEENRASIRELENYRQAHEKASSARILWGCLYFICILAMLLSLLPAADAIFALGIFPRENLILFTIGGIALFFLLLAAIIMRVHDSFCAIGRLADKLQKQVEECTAKCWAQMKPLNELYGWDISARLIEKTVPRLHFDTFFNEERLLSLSKEYGLQNFIGENESVTQVQSGTINENPFLFATIRKQGWTEHTYSGTLTIYWTEQVRDDKGHYHTVHRSQVLVGYVTRPEPCYNDYTILLYGNEAAPQLSFSRSPSSLSGGDGILNKIGKNLELHKLKSLSRNLEDDSEYTLMSNEEFEVLFHCTDRSDEVGFRLLFTPLAQRQMLMLLNDSSVGYGDDFDFIKTRKINAIHSSHLNNGFSLDTSPKQFSNYNLDDAKKRFVAYQEEYFRAIYFALAPLLAIPLYQQTPPDRVTFGIDAAEHSDFMEHESIANYYGDNYFKANNCITQCILKTSRGNRHNEKLNIRVTAHGFCGRKRLEYVSVFGGDGHFHNVPVYWIEYLPVEKQTSMYITELPRQSGYAALQLTAEVAAGRIGRLRRSIFSHL